MSIATMNTEQKQNCVKPVKNIDVIQVPCESILYYHISYDLAVNYAYVSY